MTDERTIEKHAILNALLSAILACLKASPKNEVEARKRIIEMEMKLDQFCKGDK